VLTIEQRDALRERVQRLAEDDDRVVAGAAVGLLALDEGDGFSDLELTFGVADHFPVTAVLADWTRTLIDELAAVQLADLERGHTVASRSRPSTTAGFNPPSAPCGAVLASMP
jgi:hypothetical protein